MAAPFSQDLGAYLARLATEPCNAACSFAAAEEETRIMHEIITG